MILAGALLAALSRSRHGASRTSCTSACGAWRPCLAWRPRGRARHPEPAAACARRAARAARRHLHRGRAMAGPAAAARRGAAGAAAAAAAAATAPHPCASPRSAAAAAPAPACASGGSQSGPLNLGQIFCMAPGRIWLHRPVHCPRQCCIAACMVACGGGSSKEATHACSQALTRWTLCVCLLCLTVTATVAVLRYGGHAVFQS